MKYFLHPSQRLGTAAALLLGLGLGLVACGSGDGGDSPSPDAPAGGTVRASQPGELARQVQGQLRRLEAQGWLSSGPLTGGLPTTAMESSAGVSAAPPPRSATLVQEAGVDEADLIQTDGRFLYTVQPQAGGGPLVATYERASDSRARPLAQLALAADGASSVVTDGMVLSTDQRTLAVVSQHWTVTPADQVCADLCPALAPQWMRSSVGVQRVDVGSPATPEAGARVSIDGYLVDSRQVGDALVVVTVHRPVLAAMNLPASATPAEREAAIARLTAADVLPRMRRNGGEPTALLSDTDCWLNDGNASNGVEITTLTVFDLRSATLAQRSRCIVGGHEALYMSPGSLYLATTRWAYPSGAQSLVFPRDISTDIHKFSFADGAVAFRGSGRVEGHLGWDRERQSQRLSEHNGKLRVLSYTGQFGWATPQDAATTPPSPALLTVLRESATGLAIVSTLPNSRRSAPIGKPGEQVHAVRFLGDRGYVVTFRRTDPLVVLDLADPQDPQAVGELEVAGFSDVLYPLANGLLLGVGRDADANGRIGGLKVALFDVSDPARPSQPASLTLGEAGSSSALDSSRHGLNMLVLDNIARVALPAILTTQPFAGWQQGLQRLEVDTRARTLRSLGMLASGGVSGATALGLERSVQIGDHVYYLGGGTLAGFAW